MCKEGGNAASQWGVKILVEEDLSLKDQTVDAVYSTQVEVVRWCAENGREQEIAQGFHWWNPV